jgi:hypothetical protein
LTILPSCRAERAHSIDSQAFVSADGAPTQEQLGHQHDRVDRLLQVVSHERGPFLAKKLELFERRVGAPEPVVDVLQLLSANEDLRFHLFGVNTKRCRFFLLLDAGVLETHELGHVLDAVDDVSELAAGSENRAVYRAPPALFEAAAHLVRTE